MTILVIVYLAGFFAGGLITREYFLWHMEQRLQHWQDDLAQLERCEAIHRENEELIRRLTTPKLPRKAQQNYRYN